MLNISYISIFCRILLTCYKRTYQLDNHAKYWTTIHAINAFQWSVDYLMRSALLFFVNLYLNCEIFMVTWKELIQFLPYFSIWIYTDIYSATPSLDEKEDIGKFSELLSWNPGVTKQIRHLCHIITSTCTVLRKQIWSMRWEDVQRGFLMRTSRMFEVFCEIMQHIPDIRPNVMRSRFDFMLQKSEILNPLFRIWLGS